MVSCTLSSGRLGQAFALVASRMMPMRHPFVPGLSPCTVVPHHSAPRTSDVAIPAGIASMCMLLVAGYCQRQLQGLRHVASDGLACGPGGRGWARGWRPAAGLH